jgi:AraC family transcriptional regulator of adaptative response / DNA-3-methyladenine glycosylase II
MSENRETRSRRAPIFVSMDLDQDACYRAVETRDARFDGRFFTAVKTSGIYCRPICPARTPKRENVIFYPTAAAAQEAGFRPCLPLPGGDLARPRRLARRLQYRL